MTSRSKRGFFWVVVVKSGPLPGHEAAAGGLGVRVRLLSAGPQRVEPEGAGTSGGSLWLKRARQWVTSCCRGVKSHGWSFRRYISYRVALCVHTTVWTVSFFYAKNVFVCQSTDSRLSAAVCVYGMCKVIFAIIMPATLRACKRVCDW